MRYLRLAFLPLLLVACTDQQPGAPDIEANPNLRATATSDIVYVFPERITWMDSQGPWDVFLLGYDPADDYTCNGGVPVGGIPARNVTVVSMEGFPDEFSQRDHVILNTIGRPPLYLYLRSDFPPPEATDEDWCTFLKEGWIASGYWSAALAVDNDVSGFDGTPGVNSWGGTEAGILWGADGAMYKYEWKYRAILEPERGFYKLAHSVDHVVRIK